MKKYIFIFLLIFSLSLQGCLTYYPVNVPADSLNFNDGSYKKILRIFYLKGKYDNVENTDIEYFDKYGLFKKVLVYTLNDTLKKDIKAGEQGIYSNKKIIPLDSIKSFVVERRKTDLKSTLLTSSIIIAVAAVLYIIGFSIAIHSGKFRI